MNVEIFADTTKIEELREFADWGVISGCTTNPLICANDGVTDFESHMKTILGIVKGPVSLEVTTNDPAEMVDQAECFNSWGSNVVVKLPMNIAGLKAAKIVLEKGIKVNLTVCMNHIQAMLAAIAGATFVSIFWGRIEDMGYKARPEVHKTREILDRDHMPAKIIAGSLRSVGDATRAMVCAHILTATPKLLRQMQSHPRTESTIDEFLRAYGNRSQTTLPDRQAPTKERSRA